MVLINQELSSFKLSECHCIGQLCNVIGGKSPEVVLLPGFFLQFLKLNALSLRDILKFSEVLQLKLNGPYFTDLSTRSKTHGASALRPRLNPLLLV